MPDSLIARRRCGLVWWIIITLVATSLEVRGFMSMIAGGSIVEIDVVAND